MYKHFDCEVKTHIMAHPLNVAELRTAVCNKQDSSTDESHGG